MNIHHQINEYINSLPEPKRSDMQLLHETIQQLVPEIKLWFLDGKNEENKVVSNPNIGYGQLTMHYADGKSRDFYQIGISANTSGISVYIMGISDKKYLAETYAAKIGKASISGYCIKFKRLQDVAMDVLVAAIRDAVDQQRS